MADTVQVFGVDIRNKVRRDFPFVAGAWVEFWDDALMQDVFMAENISDDTTGQKAVALVVEQIADWNFSDETGTKVPVSTENVSRLGSKSIKWLAVTSGQIIKDAVEAETAIKKESPVS